jgi:drug/metabolite transporter (DMT)-like permease
VTAAALDYSLLLSAVLLLSASQVLQKLTAQAFNTAREAPFASPRLLFAMVTLAGGTALWLAALYRVEVSRAVPFLSLGQLLVMGSAHVYLREPISRAHWVGALAIAAGVALVAAS